MRNEIVEKILEFGVDEMCEYLDLETAELLKVKDALVEEIREIDQALIGRSITIG